MWSDEETLPRQKIEACHNLCAHMLNLIASAIGDSAMVSAALVRDHETVDPMMAKTDSSSPVPPTVQRQWKKRQKETHLRSRPPSDLVRTEGLRTPMASLRILFQRLLSEMANLQLGRRPVWAAHAILCLSIIFCVLPAANANDCDDVNIGDLIV